MGALGIIGYLAAHMCLYLLWLRREALFSSETAIAVYHIASYFALVGTLSVLALLRTDAHGFALAGFAAGIHGIYSLSILELWSLTEGSYSLSLLTRINSSEPLVTMADLIDMKRIGTTKRSARQESLRRLGLISSGLDFRLTRRGRVFSALFNAIIWLSNGRTMH
jgi:hypothetical protein